jgi:hypothetical protein
MPILRTHGIYELPDGRRFVAVNRGAGTFFLYPASHGPVAPPVYEVTADGAVVPWHTGGTPYRVEDLTDTGENFKP